MLGRFKRLYLKIMYGVLYYKYIYSTYIYNIIYIYILFSTYNILCRLYYIITSRYILQTRDVFFAHCCRDSYYMCMKREVPPRNYTLARYVCMKRDVPPRNYTLARYVCMKREVPPKNYILARYVCMKRDVPPRNYTLAWYVVSRVNSNKSKQNVFLLSPMVMKSLRLLVETNMYSTSNNAKIECFSVKGAEIELNSTVQNP